MQHIRAVSLGKLLPVTRSMGVDWHKHRSRKRGGIVTSSQIDELCIDWLNENCEEESASKYRPQSLLIPMWNAPELNEALETLRQVLCMAFGAGETFGTTDYHEAKRKLELPDNRIPIPEVFIKAFAET